MRLTFTRADTDMLKHLVDVARDLIASGDEYTEQDEATVDKLAWMSKSRTAVLVTTCDDTDAESQLMFYGIVRYELDNWVPGASQRLLHRAGRIAGIPQPDPSKGQRDCGDTPSQHDLTPDCVAGLQLSRCTDCYRLFED